jgi:hypothetical protein
MEGTAATGRLVTAVVKAVEVVGICRNLVVLNR